MILFLLFQRRVLFHGWLHCFSPWFAKIHFETCAISDFSCFKIARFHGLLPSAATSMDMDSAFIVARGPRWAW